MGDNYDKTKSLLGNSSLSPAATQPNATTTPEYTTCDSDIYLAYEQMPTREIMNAIIGAGLTPDATDLTQLCAAIDAKIAAARTDGFRQAVAATGSETSDNVTVTIATSRTLALINEVECGFHGRLVIGGNELSITVHAHFKKNAAGTWAATSRGFLHESSGNVNQFVDTGVTRVFKNEQESSKMA